jgi:hypothetical protein
LAFNPTEDTTVMVEQLWRSDLGLVLFLLPQVYGLLRGQEEEVLPDRVALDLTQMVFPVAD